MNEKSGIYCIENIIDGKMYIGQAFNLKNRKRTHFRELKGNYHWNLHLQNSYNKYGKENFKFKILLYYEPIVNELTKYEQFFVDKHDSEMLYNARLECVDSNLGIKFSEETKEKMSRAHFGKHLSEETKEKISKNHADVSGKSHPMYGKYHSKEIRKKMSKNHADFSGENHPMYGKRHTEETKEKMSKAKAGEKCYLSKLTKKQVFEILDLYYNKKEKQINIAKKYNVNDRTISCICRGKTWKSCYKEFMET